MTTRASIADLGSDLTLEVAQTDGGVRMILALGKDLAIPFLFSEMFPLSVDRPWRFVPQDLDTISTVQADSRIHLVADDGAIRTEVALRFNRGCLVVDCSWTAIRTLSDVAVALSLALPPEAEDVRLTLPHILYNGNPSADPDRLVPRFDREAGACLVCEETRYPIPCVNAEWQEADGPVALSLFSVPKTNEDRWSLGCERAETGVRLLGASGVLAFNGRRDETYGVQRQAVPLERGYATMAPGDVLKKSFAIALERPSQTGWGFRSIARKGFDLNTPTSSPCLPLDDVIALKTNALRNRWHETDDSAGYICVLPGSIYESPLYYLYGWTGQSLRLAWCDARSGIDTGDDAAIDRCRRAVDFYVLNSGCAASGLRHSRFLLETSTWIGEVSDGEGISSRAFGEAMTNLGKVIRLFRTSGLDVPSAWVDAVDGSADFLLRRPSSMDNGIFPAFWTVDGVGTSDLPSAAGTPCLTALLEAHRVTGEERYLQGVGVVLDRYWQAFGDRFDRPFARSTLDARCEDKEAGLYFFLAAYELFVETGDRRIRELAEVAADWILTFVYHWDTGFRPGTLCQEKGFVTTGWPGVSVQNHHLDVFFPAYELYDFGKRIGSDRYVRLGRTVFDAWSHGICREPGDWEHEVPGEQGEQFFQTNFYQGPFDTQAWRGGYNRWNPSWIVALVLEAGLNFRSATDEGSL